MMNTYLTRSKKIVFLYVIVAFVTYLCLTAIYGSYSFITETTENGNLSDAYKVTFLCGVVLITLLFLLIVLSIVKRNILFEVTKNLRQNVFEKTYKIDFLKFYKNNTTYYSSMLLNDVETVEDEYFFNLIELLGDSVQLLVMLFSIALIGWEYLLIVIIFSIPSLIQPFVLRKKLSNHGLKVSDERHIYTEKVKEFIYSFEIIKTYRKEKVFDELFGNTVSNLENKKKNQEVVKSINTCILILAVYIVKVGSQLYFINSAILGAITVATVTLLLGLANNVGNPIASILEYITAMNGTKEVRKKILDFLDEEVVDVTAGDKINSISKGITFKDVFFSYEEGNSILNGLSIEFNQGKKYALLGESGSGKSTILKLLMGYYPNYRGNIKIDELEISNINFHNLRDNIAYINQNVFMFEGTLKDNITLFDDKYTDEHIHEVINSAGLSDVVSNLPQGIHSEIKEGGSNFSGGEKQRIALARALLSEASIILVDEGASALDNITAVNVEKTLLMMEGKTIISIIHRVNETIHLYDTIYILVDGVVVKEGDYNSLKDEDDYFKQDETLDKGGDVNE